MGTKINKSVRDHITKKDKSIRLTSFLSHSNFLNSLLIIFLNFFFFLIRAIFKENEDKRKTLVIICLHRLGDTVFSIPAMTEIFKNFEGYSKYILTFKETEDILRLKFKDENIITIDRSEIIFHGRFATKKANEIVNKLKPSYIIDLTGTPASASLIFNKRTVKLVGMNLPYFKNIYDDFIPKRKEPHFIDIYLDVARLINPSIGTASEFEFETRIYPINKILIHPFAIRKAKEWNFNKFIELALKLREKYQVKIVTPDYFIPEDVYDELADLKLDVTITKTIHELISEINEAGIFISNDSGPTYIAGLIGKPTFSIYGPTNPKYSLPFGKFHRYYQKKLVCSATDEMFCFTLAGIDCPTNECMNNISVNEVKSCLVDFLEELGVSKIS